MKIEMKKAILLCVLLLPMLTFGLCVSDLPVCEYADTEVETNMPFRVSLDDMSWIEVASDERIEVVGRKPGVGIVVW